MGVLFILAAAALVISNLFPEMLILGGITFWQIAAAVLFGALLIKGFARGSAVRIFFSIAIIYSVFIPQISNLIGRDIPNAWIALLTALLLSVGVKLIF